MGDFEYADFVAALGFVIERFAERGQLANSTAARALAEEAKELEPGAKFARLLEMFADGFEKAGE